MADATLDLDELGAALARTPAALHALLDGLAAERAHARPAPGTWSVFDVVGHLTWGELDDWLPRARHLLEHGRERPFAPFDREAMFARDAGKTLPQVLDEFAAARAVSLAELTALRLDARALARQGEHPALGTVTLANLLATWLVHDHAHLAQIARALAAPHADAVGPWRAYLPVLPRPLEVRFATRIAAPRAAVWAALTTPAGLDAWFTQGAAVDLRAGGSITFRWPPGAGVVESGGPVDEVVPPERLVFRWDAVHGRPELLTTVVLTLETLADGATRVAVHETGFPPTDEGRRSQLSNATGWGEALTLLRSQLESAPLRWTAV